MSTVTALALTPLHAGDLDGPPFPFLLVPLTLWLVVVGLVVWFVLSRRRHDRASGVRAGEQVLAERYAAGDIDEKDYRIRRAGLREEG